VPYCQSKHKDGGTWVACVELGFERRPIHYEG